MREGRWLPLLDLCWLLVGVTSDSPLLLSLLLSSGFRWGLVLTALSNEWGHLVVARLVGARGAVSLPANLCGNRPLAAHLWTLVPGMTDSRGDLTVRLRATRRQIEVIRRGGFWLGAALSVVIALAWSSFGLLGVAWGLGTALALVGAFVTDMTKLSPYAANPGIVACGNVTLLGRITKERGSAFPAHCRRLLRDMLRVSQMRGAQSGGGAVLVEQNRQARVRIEKCVNSKRGDLPLKMVKRLSSTANGRQVPGSTFVVQTHVRYATAGITQREEAHPFCYVDLPLRGPRRVTTWHDGRPVVTTQPVETVLTHNGDMDGLRLRGFSLQYAELRPWLERVLGIPNRWVGDSPLLAGAIDLFLTQGMWQESFRLAHTLVVAPPTRESPVLASQQLAFLESSAEAVLAECAEVNRSNGAADPPSQRRLREQVIERLGQVIVGQAPDLVGARTPAFVRAAVSAFFDNDLYVALRRLEPALLGTFGCVVTTTLEPGVFVALSRGQPLSLGFHRVNGLVCAVSERAAMKVKSPDDQLAFDERLDLDLCRGELARVSLDDSGGIHLTLYGISQGREVFAEELAQTGRLVPLQANPYIAPLPPHARDRVLSDLAALPSVLRGIRAHWSEDAATNPQTAQCLAEFLFEAPRARLVVIGITNELWLSQQFAKNLMLVFPNVDVVVKSSNEVLADEGRFRLEAGTVLLAVSQTGQDFPTLGALLLLTANHPWLSERCFVLTGEVDTLMGQAVGQSYARGAPFCRRIFSNGSGFRASEAVLLPVNALQHTFDELLLFLTRRSNELSSSATPGVLTPSEVRFLHDRRDELVDKNAPLLLGGEADGQGSVAQALRNVSRRFSLHVLEWGFAFALCICVLEANVGFGLGLLPSSSLSFLPEAGWGAVEWLRAPLWGAARQLDVAFYAFLTPAFVWLLRLVQGRPLLHRQGPRELLIADTEYVHRILWLFARRLFASSYGFASVKVYSANNQDEFVLTHEPVRGTLALLGLPHRRDNASTGPSPAVMSAKQFNNSRSFAGAGAEIVTFGQGSGVPGLGTHVELPMGPRPVLGLVAQGLNEGMFDSWERLLAMQLVVERMARSVASLPFFQFDRSRTKDQVFAPTTAAPVSAADIYQVLSRAAERYEGQQHEPLPFEVNQSDWRGTAPPVKTTFWTADGQPLKLES